VHFLTGKTPNAPARFSMVLAALRLASRVMNWFAKCRAGLFMVDVATILNDPVWQNGKGFQFCLFCEILTDSPGGNTQQSGIFWH
jgi:hypothetical protein